MKIPTNWVLPPAIAARLGEKSGRQRALLEDGHLLLVLHRLPMEDSREREGVLFWRLPNGHWQCSDAKPGLEALQEHLETYAEAVDDLEARYDKADDAAGFYRVLDTLTPIHRAAANLHGALQCARQGVPKARELISLRDTATDIDHASELLLADVKNALDYLVARHNEEQAHRANEMAHAGNRLNWLAAVFLPLTAVTSIFGMNLHSGLEMAPPWVFWIILIFGALLGFLMRGLLPR